MGVGYQSSGILNSPLRDGYYCAIGISWPRTDTVFSYLHMTEATFPIATSFGQLTSGNAYQNAPPSSIAYAQSNGYWFAPQRLTTAP